MIIYNDSVDFVEMLANGMELGGHHGMFFRCNGENESIYYFNCDACCDYRKMKHRIVELNDIENNKFGITNDRLEIISNERKILPKPSYGIVDHNTKYISVDTELLIKLLDRIKACVGPNKIEVDEFVKHLANSQIELVDFKLPESCTDYMVCQILNGEMFDLKMRTGKYVFNVDINESHCLVFKSMAISNFMCIHLKRNNRPTSNRIAAKSLDGKIHDDLNFIPDDIYNSIYNQIVSQVNDFIETLKFPIKE